MCGIWAIFSKNLGKTIINKMLAFNTIKNRGPDKTTMHIYNNYSLGFHRLAIHDLSVLGDQPFTFIADNCVYHLIVNGEIYNYKELIKKYKMDVISNSDCEVIYHLFKIKKNIIDTIQELEGEFAFIFIVNNIITNTVTAYVCRDRIGVRPLFYSTSLNNEFMFSSLLSGLADFSDNNDCVFPPGKCMILNFNDNKVNSEMVTYYDYIYPIIKTPSNLYYEITSRLIKAVHCRLDSDRAIGALLSGGLDSSLICAIATKILQVDNLRTFSIGMTRGTDLEYADKVVKHLNTDHTEILFTKEEGLNVINDVINTTETWDITTIRASVGQYLLGQYISKNTDIKVILNGDGADEVEMGYLYFYLAPDAHAAQEESIKLVKEIHRYDGLRVDRCISNHGLEARLPYLDTNFVDYYMSIDPELKICTKTRMEKQLIRDAFNYLYPDLLPKEVMYRKKEAFSDGVSSKEKSWFELITEWIDEQMTDEEYSFLRKYDEYKMCKSKEALYYRKKFNEKFNKKFEHNDVIPKYWLPNWVETNGEPSARILNVYK